MEKDAIIKEITKAVRKYLDENYKILVFGSWAKGNALGTSDIDIGILGPDEIPWSAMAKIKQEVEKIPTLRSIDIVDLNAVDEGFKINVLGHAKFLA